MRVFLSWSGQKSHEVALALRNWLPEIVNDLDPWMSSEDIEKGAAWSATIAEQLESSNFGIICLTRENRDRVWLNYEAGAIAKAMFSGNPKGRAATFLIDIEQESEITGPLAQFQHTKPNRADLLRLMSSLNAAAGFPRTPDQLERAVIKWWPDLETAITKANSRTRPQTKKRARSDRELLEEILNRVREMAADDVVHRRTPIFDAPTSSTKSSPRTSVTEELRQLIARQGDADQSYAITGEGDAILLGFNEEVPSYTLDLLERWSKRNGIALSVIDRVAGSEGANVRLWNTRGGGDGETESNKN